MPAAIGQPNEPDRSRNGGVLELEEQDDDRKDENDGEEYEYHRYEDEGQLGVGEDLERPLHRLNKRAKKGNEGAASAASVRVRLSRFWMTRLLTHCRRRPAAEAGALPGQPISLPLAPS